MNHRRNSRDLPLACPPPDSSISLEKSSTKVRAIPCKAMKENGLCLKGKACDFSHEIKIRSIKASAFQDEIVPLIHQQSISLTQITRQLDLVLKTMLGFHNRLSELERLCCEIKRGMDNPREKSPQREA